MPSNQLIDARELSATTQASRDKADAVRRVEAELKQQARMLFLLLVFSTIWLSYTRFASVEQRSSRYHILLRRFLLFVSNVLLTSRQLVPCEPKSKRQSRLLTANARLARRWRSFSAPTIALQS